MVAEEAAALRYDCCAEKFLEAASLSMNSQKTVQACAVIQPEPEFVPVLDYSRASCTRSAGQW